MQPRAHQTSEYEGFRKGMSANYGSPMQIKNGDKMYYGGWNNEDIGHAVLGAVALPPLAYGAYKLVNHLRNKPKQ